MKSCFRPAILGLLPFISASEADANVPLQDPDTWHYQGRRRLRLVVPRSLLNDRFSELHTAGLRLHQASRRSAAFYVDRCCRRIEVALSRTLQYSCGIARMRGSRGARQGIGRWWLTGSRIQADFQIRLFSHFRLKKSLTQRTDPEFINIFFEYNFRTDFEHILLF